MGLELILGWSEGSSSNWGYLLQNKVYHSYTSNIIEIKRDLLGSDRPPRPPSKVYSSRDLACHPQATRVRGGSLIPSP